MSDNTLTAHQDGSATLSHDRLNACLEAAWELEVLAQVLPGLVPNVSETHGAHYAVRGIAHRIWCLSRMVMGGLSDNVETVQALERALFMHPPMGAARSMF